MIIDSKLRKKPTFPLLEKFLIDLTNEMLRTFTITTILFVLLKILEHLQIIYFLMRAINNEYHWNFSFLVFVSMFLNFVSVDQLFKSSPELFKPIFYGLVIVIVVVYLMAILISGMSGWGKRPPFIIKLFAQILSTFCYL